MKCSRINIKWNHSHWYDIDNILWLQNAQCDIEYIDI